MKGTLPAILALTFVGAHALQAPAWAQPQGREIFPDTLTDAQYEFYSGRYEAAAALALEARDANALAASELRSSALLFQIRRAFGDPKDRDTAWKACTSCQELLPAFLTETAHGRTLARARLDADPTDETALYFLGKLNLNHIWLHLGTLGRRTGWSEYWEARKSLDKVLASNPGHVRARVARAWIDYIVDTRVPWGTKWLLGGGSKERGLRVVQEAALADGDPFAQAEAMFALWDMQVREKDLAEAVVTARALKHEFPGNQELTRFIEAHAAVSRSEPLAPAYDASPK